MKKRLTGYTFDASAKTVLHADFSDITLEGIQLIVNTTDQIIIYNFADTAKGGTLATDTLTLEYDTTAMDDADKLMILIDDGVAAQAITAASLPLPTGAATQATLNNVYSDTSLLASSIYTEAATDATITGIPVMWEDTSDTLRAVSAAKPLPIGGNVAAAATDSGNPVKAGGKYSSTLPTYTDGQRGDFQVGTKGSLSVQLYGADSGSAVATGAQADALTNSSSGLYAISRTSVYNGSTWDRQRGDTVGTYVIPKPTTTGGYTIFRSLDIDETEEDVKTSAGQVYGWYIGNLASSVRYVKFYNATAASVIVGTTVPVLTLPIPANGAANLELSTGIAFSTAICVAATTGVADADTGAPAANDVVINVLYT